ncbi:hypothetical protein [Kitasatospora purpeofusca]|uniref:Uncharacterized protein n=1 Tax=Kitasatospora purpeofusca TaxID=67352 RepID=A0ABZ1TRV1_9ACTN|nr:hypothetical protein [Kitasatospora purpeofusca]
MAKINIATHLNKAFTGAVRARLGADAALVETRVCLGAGRDAVAAEVTSLLGILTVHQVSGPEGGRIVAVVATGRRPPVLLDICKLVLNNTQKSLSSST